jgi:RimJ/RimL family protein N-acetyltransferase
MEEDGRTVGILMMMRKNHITWELHVGFHPDVWGTGVPRKFGKEMIRTAFEETGAKKLIAMIPVDYEPVWKFAKYCGMKIEGTAKKAWQKNGVVHDAYYLGVYK